EKVFLREIAPRVIGTWRRSRELPAPGRRWRKLEYHRSAVHDRKLLAVRDYRLGLYSPSDAVRPAWRAQDERSVFSDGVRALFKRNSKAPGRNHKPFASVRANAQPRWL